MTRPRVYRCELAWLPGGRVVAGVDIEVADGRIIAVREGRPGTRRATGEEPGAPAPTAASVEHLPGLVLPGLANAHSHAFHRALRGRTHTGGGTFWTWRERMYAVAARLDPERLHALARATFAEMVLAGITAVGEFHYVHHAPDGTPYADPNAMGEALVAAAREAGIRLTLLDACYLAGGIGQPLTVAQRRFGDRDVQAWAARAEALATRHAGADDIAVGAAIHSVRAVPARAIPTVATWAERHAAPLHVHVSEQPAENAACRAAYGCTPTRLLHDRGAFGPRTTAIHATHVTPDDIALLAAAGAGVCLCPTTERDLGDGIGPARALEAAGVPLALGTDGHARIDLLEEARSLELDQRLVHLERGVLPLTRLLDAASVDGHRRLGWSDAGRLEVGARADLVAVDLTSVRTVGAPAADAAATAVFAASAADVTDVVVGGRRIVRDRDHVLGDVAALLARAIDGVTEEAAP
ncbi:MAG: formimidoylglutamate deiminase [Nitriliruptoraceae bacterium]